MNTPGPGGRTANPAAVPGVKQAARGKLRVLGEDGRGRAIATSVVMPRANTDLSAMFARDGTLCVRPRPISNAVQEPSTALPAAAPQPPVDADLARVTEIWPALPSSTRAAIVAMAFEAVADEK
jgi:hypothetical protein